jgi:hypothetical protein
MSVLTRGSGYRLAVPADPAGRDAKEPSVTYPPYPPPAYGHEHPQATTILVLGILSLVLCAPLGIAAWVMGKRALAEAAAMGATNTATIKAGYICGIIGTSLMLLGLAFVIFVFIAAAMSVGAGSY